jgi:hypothetical protein
MTVARRFSKCVTHRDMGFDPPLQLMKYGPNAWVRLSPFAFLVLHKNLENHAIYEGLAVCSI